MIAVLDVAAPWAACLALLLLPYVWFLRARDRVAARRAAVWLGPRARALAATPSGTADAAAKACGAAAIALLAAALCGPSWGDGAAAADAPGHDVIVCLDVSKSMLARDVAPSRLEAARAAVVALARRARGDRFGLVAFAGEARLLVPLTGDIDSFVELVASADELSVGRGGTDLGSALDTALSALVGGERGAVLLLTDGEDHGGRGLQAAQRCAAQGVVVHCLLLGSERGSKVPVEAEGGEVFLRGRDGADVVSRPDRESLAAIAAATGGELLAAAGPGDLLALHDRGALRPAARARPSGEALPVARFQWPLALAVACWLLQLWLMSREPALARARN